MLAFPLNHRRSLWLRTVDVPLSACDGELEHIGFAVIKERGSVQAYRCVRCRAQLYIDDDSVVVSATPS